MRRYLKTATWGRILGAVLGATWGAFHGASVLASLSRTISATSRARLARILAWTAIIGFSPVLFGTIPGSPHKSDKHTSNKSRPNILLITIDALRADHLGAYGSRKGLTPNLDAFARKATIYRSAYASAPWTLPSLGSLFTGLQPSECGLTGSERENSDWYYKSARISPSVPVFPELLQRAGYHTGAETANVFLIAERGFGRGFDDFHNEGGEVGPNAEATRAGNVTQKALAWLRLNNRQPFFLWLHYLDPHTPYTSPDTPLKLRKRYPQKWESKRKFWEKLKQSSEPAVIRRYQDFSRSMYGEEVRYVDRWVGKLLVTLQQKGLDRNTLIVITADHGEELFDHGGFEHGHSMHEELLWVPLLIRWPWKTSADKEITQTVALSSLSGTFLSFAGAQPAGRAAWKSLPLRNGGPGDEIYSESILWGPEQVALTTNAYRLIDFPYAGKGQSKYKIYDRKTDRKEFYNIAGLLSSTVKPERLIAQTRAKSGAQPSKRNEKGPLALPEANRKQLQSLGYIGH